MANDVRRRIARRATVIGTGVIVTLTCVLFACSHASQRKVGALAQVANGNGNLPPSELITTSPRPPIPLLGPGVPPPGLLVGLSPDEVARVQMAPTGSRLANMRDLAANHARLKDPILEIDPGRHLIDRTMNTAVPANLALDLGFLISWNELIDALGLAYVVTGDPRYAARVDEHLRPWAQYSPPMGVGLEEGGEPSIYHREFIGAFRAIEHCWPALTPTGKAAAVHLATTIQDRTGDWWKHTPWTRGNHAAATAQTGIYAGIILVRAAVTDPALITLDEADRRLNHFLDSGHDIPQVAMVGGAERAVGLVGFGVQARIGILTPANLAIWQTRGDVSPDFFGASIDYFYKPPEQRFGYHALVTHHLLTSYWALVRCGIDQKRVANSDEVRAALGSLLDFTRPYLELGRPLQGAKSRPPDPATDGGTREVIGMAARLFPEKAWLQALLPRGEPTSFAEIYSEAAAFR